MALTCRLAPYPLRVLGSSGWVFGFSNLIRRHSRLCLRIYIPQLRHLRLPVLRCLQLTQIPPLSLLFFTPAVAILDACVPATLLTLLPVIDLGWPLARLIPPRSGCGGTFYVLSVLSLNPSKFRMVCVPIVQGVHGLGRFHSCR